MREKPTEIIARILAGESTAEDEIIINEWLSESNKRLKDFAEREKIWNATEIILSRKNFDTGEAFKKFNDLIRKPATTRLRDRRHFKKTAMNSLKWAAVGLLLITAGAIAGYFTIDHIRTPGSGLYEIKAPTGSRSNIVLADGTGVWLNAGSRIKFSPDFGKKDRIVHLEGEGYFTVARDRKHPFIVSTSELEIEAIGTSFNVKSYPQEEIIQTTLVSGSVLVSRRNHKLQERGIMLEPNQQITYYRETEELAVTGMDPGTGQEDIVAAPAGIREIQEPPKIILRREIDPELFTSWKDNRLIFDNEPFESIAVKLERRFGANIIIGDDEIKNKKFKGRFDEITIEQALSALKFASPFEYHIKQDTIFIKSQK